MVQLKAGDERFRRDQGDADPAVAAALLQYAAGTGTEQAVLTALAGARLLVPVVAVLADHLADSRDAVPPEGRGRRSHASDEAAKLAAGGEKASEMAMPAIIGRDGRRALPAFTAAAALRIWQPDARPVPVPAAGVWQSAVQESAAVIIDIAGPVPIAVEGARLAALASGSPVPDLHEDPDVWQVAVAAAGRIAPGIRVRLSPPEGGVDFTLELAPPSAANAPVPAEAADAIAEAVAQALGVRMRNGVAVMVHPADGP